MTDDEQEEPARIRLGGGAGGPEHLAAARAEQRDLRRRRVAAAIEALETGEAERFPDMAAILEHADGAISKNRIYEEQDLMYAAQSRWNEREKAAGRSTRRLRGGDRQELDDWVSRSDLDDANAHLRRAIEEIRDLRARNERLSKENKGLRLDVERLEVGVVDEIWPPKGEGGQAGRGSGSATAEEDGDQRDSGPCDESS